jgi:hypothetical protein
MGMKASPFKSAAKRGIRVWLCSLLSLSIVMSNFANGAPIICLTTDGRAEVEAGDCMSCCQGFGDAARPVFGLSEPSVSPCTWSKGLCASCVDISSGSSSQFPAGSRFQSFEQLPLVPFASGLALTVAEKPSRFIFRFEKSSLDFVLSSLRSVVLLL